MFAHVQHVLSLKFCSHSTRNTAMGFEHYRENTRIKLLPNVTDHRTCKLLQQLVRATEQVATKLKTPCGVCELWCVRGVRVV